MSKDEETEPLWLSGENDHLIQKDQETEPLFGSGKIPLDGDYDPPNTQKSQGDDDVESQPTTNYGSIKDGGGGDSKGSRDGSSWSKTSNSKKTKKKKKQAPPPKSIFDEDSEKEIPDDDSSVTGTEALESKPHMPPPNYCLYFFRFVAWVAVVGSLGLIVTQLIPLILAPHKQGFLDFALKVYVTLFCILFLLVEMNVPIPFLRKSNLLQIYLSRGFLYSFLGLICVSEAYSERVKEIINTHADEFHVAWLSLFMQISSWLMLGCGLFYMLMGVCCLKRLRDKLAQKDKDAWTKYRKDMKEWKRLNAK